MLGTGQTQGNGSSAEARGNSSVGETTSAPPPEPGEGKRIADGTKRINVLAAGTTAMAATGVVIFALNMFAAWVIAYSSSTFVAQPLAQDTGSATRHAMQAVANGVDPNLATFMTRIVEADVHLKAIANKQSLVMVAMAAGFGLFALGFSLFIMGMRGALELAGGKPEVGPIVLRSTSPGLVCFVLGAALIGYGVSRETSVDFGEVRYVLPEPSVAAPRPLPPAPKPIDMNEVDRILKGGAQ